ncbi:MAG: EAL domain-containing protein [Treponema sp.]|nr:EAL domain-containing protein [Treponema sp.]
MIYYSTTVQLDPASKEVFAYFQPILAADTNRIYSYEVLGRYKDDDGSIKSLGNFFADKNTSTQAALDIDRVVRKYALRKYAQEGRGEYLFINIRLEWIARYGNRPEEIPTLKWAREFGINPEKLVIEITEEEFNANREDYSDVLAYYKDAGCRIAIDDYGKSANNIERLASVSPDIMKIDIDYIHKSERSYHYREYLRALAGFAESVGIEVLYEGIETPKQLDICMSSRGRYYQGFLFARPQASIRDAEADCSVFESASSRSVSALQTDAEHRNSGRGIWDNMVSGFLAKNTFTPEEAGIDDYFSRLCLYLPDNVIRVYVCDPRGYQISRNIERTAGGIDRVPGYKQRNWAWRGYFRKAMTAFEMGNKSYLTVAYCDVTTKKRVYTYIYALTPHMFLFIDILRIPHPDGIENPYLPFWRTGPAGNSVEWTEHGPPANAV